MLYSCLYTSSFLFSLYVNGPELSISFCFIPHFFVTEFALKVGFILILDRRFAVLQMVTLFRRNQLLLFSRQINLLIRWWLQISPKCWCLFTKVNDIKIRNAAIQITSATIAWTLILTVNFTIEFYVCSHTSRTDVKSLSPSVCPSA